MEYYEDLTNALKQLAVAQSFRDAGRLDAYTDICGPCIDCDEDFLYGNWYDLINAVADFVDVRWDESETCERMYFSDEPMRQYFTFVKQHADGLGIRMKDDPYYKDICTDVYDTLLDACPYSCSFNIVTQTHHKYGFGLSVWVYCEQFYDPESLLDGILQVIWLFSHRVSGLKAQGLIPTDNLIPFPEPDAKEAA